MRWEKKGLIYVPDGNRWWTVNGYAHIPTVELINDELIRVYFASLDKNKYGRIGYIEVDIDNPKKIINIAEEPALDIGQLGTFDDCGVNPACLLNINGKKYLYYIGWQRCERVPYMLYTGLAISHDGNKFERISRAPILERTNDEPFFKSAITIIFDENIFKAWYVSAVKWIMIGGVQYPSYIIKYADSKDGIKWDYYPYKCINFQDDYEYGFGRPWVIKDNNIYKMWYSIRSRVEPYKIGYAESDDGLNWIRKDNEVGISRSESGWDSEMICYPCVVYLKGKLHMFYNGNKHGSSGFGYAVLEEKD